MVIEEYEGDASHVGQGVREAFLLAGEEAADPADHSIIKGTVPPGATLRLQKQFTTPSHPNAPGNPTVPETLESTLVGPANGNYEWHVDPSSRPDLDAGPGQTPPAETWTMTCERPGQGTFGPVQVAVNRGQQVTQDWGDGPGNPCGTAPVPTSSPDANFDFTPAAPEVGQQVNFISTSTDPDGAIDPLNTKWDLDNDTGTFDERPGLTATRTFNGPGMSRCRRSGSPTTTAVPTSRRRSSR